MANKDDRGEKLQKSVDEVLRLLQDLFILQASMAGMKRQEVRKTLGVDIKRVNRISRHIGKPGSRLG